MPSVQLGGSLAGKLCRSSSSIRRSVRKAPGAGSAGNVDGTFGFIAHLLEGGRTAFAVEGGARHQGTMRASGGIRIDADQQARFA
jgi:hypothetical protein